MNETVRLNPHLQHAQSAVTTALASRLSEAVTKRYASICRTHVLPFLSGLRGEPTLFPVPSHLMLLLMGKRFTESGTLYAPSVVFDAVRWLHKQMLHPAYEDESFFHTFIQEKRKSAARHVQHTVKAEPEWIVRMITYCSRVGASALEQRTGVVVAICYITCSRKGDVIRLRIGCILIKEDRISIRFWITKTDQLRSGFRKDISRTTDHLQICTFIIKYMSAIGALTLSESDLRQGAPLFGRVLQGNQALNRFATMQFWDKPITAATFNSAFNKIRDLLQLPQEFKPHTLRVASATDLYSALPLEMVKRGGGWVSDTIYEYLDKTEKERLQQSETLSAQMKSAFPSSAAIEHTSVLDVLLEITE